MAEAKDKLFLYEAIELRNDYDHHIRLLEALLDGGDFDQENYYRDDKEEKEPAADFNNDVIEKALKKLQTKRVKLNQAIQMANFTTPIQFEGEKISVAEALEIRKRLKTDLAAEQKRVVKSAFKRIIHKEERDIVHESKYTFTDSYQRYLESLRKLRQLALAIHKMNHESIVNFREE
jgi:hypothetical protein